MTEIVREGNVAVIEASNEDLRELYYFTTPLPLEVVMREQCEHPPAPIAHWKKGQSIQYREIEADLDPAAARLFLESFVRFLGTAEYKVLPR